MLCHMWDCDHDTLILLMPVTGVTMGRETPCPHIAALAGGQRLVSVKTPAHSTHSSPPTQLTSHRTKIPPRYTHCTIVRHDSDLRDEP